MQAALREILRGGVLGRMRVGMRVDRGAHRPAVLLAARRHADGSGVEPEGAGDDDRADAPGRRLALPHRADRAWRRPPTASSSATSTCAATAIRRSAAAISTRWRARWRAGACAAIAGAVVADPRRIGADEPIADAESATTTRTPVDATEDTPPGKLSPRVPLVVNHGLMLIRVRPGAEPGAPAEVTTTPADPSFVDPQRRGHQGAAALARHGAPVGQRVAHPDRRRGPRVAPSGGGIVFRRRVPHQALYAAALMRASLQSAGITVRDDARVAPTPRAEAGPRAAAAGAARVGAARDPAAQDQQGLRQRLRRARAGGGGRRGLRRRADRRQGRAPAARGDRRAGPAAGQLRAAQRFGAGARQPHHRRRDVGAAAHAVPRSARRARRSCSRCRWAASTAPPATASRGRSPPSACAPRPARCTASRASRAWSATAPTCSRSRSWSRGSAGGSLAEVRGAQVGCVNAMMRYVYEATEGPRAARRRARRIGDRSRDRRRQRGRGGGPDRPRRAAGTAAQAHEDPIDAFLRKQRENAAPASAPAAAGSGPAGAPDPAARDLVAPRRCSGGVLRGSVSRSS